MLLFLHKSIHSKIGSNSGDRVGDKAQASYVGSANSSKMKETEVLSKEHSQSLLMGEQTDSLLVD